MVLDGRMRQSREGPSPLRAPAGPSGPGPGPVGTTAFRDAGRPTRDEVGEPSPRDAGGADGEPSSSLRRRSWWPRFFPASPSCSMPTSGSSVSRCRVLIPYGDRDLALGSARRPGRQTADHPGLPGVVRGPDHGHRCSPGERDRSCCGGQRPAGGERHRSHRASPLSVTRRHSRTGPRHRLVVRRDGRWDGGRVHSRSPGRTDRRLAWPLLDHRNRGGDDCSRLQS